MKTPRRELTKQLDDANAQVTIARSDASRARRELGRVEERANKAEHRAKNLRIGNRFGEYLGDSNGAIAVTDVEWGIDYQFERFYIDGAFRRYPEPRTPRARMTLTLSGDPQTLDRIQRFMRDWRP